MVLLFGDDTDAEIAAGRRDRAARSRRAGEAGVRALARPPAHELPPQSAAAAARPAAPATPGSPAACSWRWSRASGCRRRSSPSIRTAPAPCVRRRRLGREHTLLDVADAQPRRRLVSLSDSRASSGRPPATGAVTAQALHYRVETTVRRTTDLGGVTTVRLKVLAPGLRVLPIDLMRSCGSSTPLRRAGGGGRRRGAGGRSAKRWRWCRRTRRRTAATPRWCFRGRWPRVPQVLLRIAYQGDGVLEDGGDKNYLRRARESWYPNLGVFATPAAYDLTYRVPARQPGGVGRPAR
jgi:hypothetical protein